MNRDGTTLLVGTLLATLLLSPGIRSSPDVGKAVSTSAVPSQTTAKGSRKETRLPCTTAACKKLIDTGKEGREEYRGELEELITDVCQTTQVRKEPQDAAECRKPSNFIIALVPDPVHTHLALVFDRTIDVIEEAVQDEGYIFDRALTPWDRKAHPDPDDYESRLEGEEYQKGREELPGLIAFHGDSEGKWLFVLVVAETPTSGVREKQFENAIGMISSATGVDIGAGWKVNLQKEPGLRILGPTFSGSLHSLRKLLTCGTDIAPKRCYPLVSIHSGTVSSRDAILSFDEDEQIQRFNIHFVSLHESDDVMIDRFVEFLTGRSYERNERGLGYATRDVAILSEDETTYGRWNGPESKRDCNTEAAASDQGCILKLNFPREISQLRAAYQDSLTTTPPTSQGRSTPGGTLPPNFSVPGSDDDTVTPYSAKQMPLSQESVLLAIVSELQKHKIKFVILRATDPLDTLFLSQFLRSAYPQGRVVTIEADLLFRRVASDPQLHGVLALSTYSLAPKANHFFRTFENQYEERIFPSSLQVGTYNATRSLLTAWVDRNVGKDCKERDNAGADCRHELVSHQAAKDKQDPQLYQYGWLRECERENCQPKYDAPPARLLALGRDDYWPIAALGPYGKERPTTLPRVATQIAKHWDKPEIPNSWRVMELIVIVLLVGPFCVVVWRSSVFAGWQMNAALAPALPDARSTVVLVMGSTLVLILLILLWPYVKYADPYSHRLDHVLLWCAAGVVFLFTLADLVSRALLAKRQSPSARWRSWILVLLFVTVSAFFSYGVRFGQPHDDPAFRVRFAMLRATQLTSGLSFIMPTVFFLAVWLWWAYEVGGGFVLLDGRRPRLPIGMESERVKRLGESSALRSAFELEPKQSLAYLLLLAGVIYVVWWLGDHYHPLMTLERPDLAWFMWLLLYLAVGGVVATTFRLLTIWPNVRRLLAGLDSQPLREGFKPLGLAWKPIWKLGAGSLDELQRVFSRKEEALEWARNTLTIKVNCSDQGWRTANDRADQEWKETKRLVQECLRLPLRYSINWWRRRKLEVEIIQQLSKMQKAMAEVAGFALDYLAWAWSVQKEPAAWEGLPGVNENVRACERFVCLVFASFLRAMLVRIRTMIAAIGWMYVFLLIGITLYPFEPKSFIQVVLVILLVVIVLAVGTVFVQIHRDPVLSDLTDTTPGQLGTDFWIRIVSFTAVPLLTLLASQFPSINRFIYSWLQPGLQALNH